MQYEHPTGVSHSSEDHGTETPPQSVEKVDRSRGQGKG